MNTDGTGFHTCKECNKTEYLSNHTTTGHKEGEQLEDRRSVGASSCNCGDGTDHRVQSLMFMVMMMMMYRIYNTGTSCPSLATSSILSQVLSSNTNIFHVFFCSQQFTGMSRLAGLCTCSELFIILGVHNLRVTLFSPLSI